MMNVSASALFLIGIVLIAGLIVHFLPSRRPPTRESNPDELSAPGTISRDDARYWLAGVIYNNPNDPDLFVPKRFGIGMTVNFGRPLGKLFLLVPLLLPLAALVLRSLSRS